MPRFLEKKLEREYPNNPHAVYGTMNKLGAMHGNKETKKGERMESNYKSRALDKKKKESPMKPIDMTEHAKTHEVPKIMRRDYKK